MKKLFKRKSGKRGPVRAKKVSYDGIDFASGLEKHMYIALKKAKIKTNTKVKLLFYYLAFILKTRFMKDKLMVKEIIKTEVKKEFYLLNILLTLLVMIL